MKPCPKCACAITPGASDCAACGFDLAPEVPDGGAQSPTSSHGGWILMVVLTGVGVLVAPALLEKFFRRLIECSLGLLIGVGC